jgi:hypothetical protein
VRGSAGIFARPDIHMKAAGQNMDLRSSEKKDRPST